ncbi:PREDICTED: uncharacterized protein LOC107330406 [Acropora digitifera]|uniref:uncharacterized protein LOC107330406 n=1 Tax=Acropora digitifera TaxID=70779 RepID=UPI00077AB8A0|nr:PREDICTED: uncharacterized protein LOC107330406 [Acropora digitifera]
MDCDDFVFKKRRFLVQDTRKVDCTAQIKMREVLVFPEYKIVENTKSRRETFQNICEKHWRQVTQNQKEEFSLSYLFCPTTNITFSARLLEYPNLLTTA